MRRAGVEASDEIRRAAWSSPEVGGDGAEARFRFCRKRGGFAIGGAQGVAAGLA